jgi:hypothetical protein
LILIGRLEAEQFGTSSCSLSRSTNISPIALEQDIHAIDGVGHDCFHRIIVKGGQP